MSQKTEAGETRIVGCGIEWFRIPGREQEEDCQCARCGSSCGWDDCCNCGGEGYIDRFHEDPLWYDEDDLYPCDWCRGKGGHWFCLSTEKWCKANPLPGREHINTTAWPEESDATTPDSAPSLSESRAAGNEKL